jgi:hypothetical protein
MGNITEETKLEKFYTGDELINELWDCCLRNYGTPTSVLENSAGSGNIIDFVKEKGVQYSAYDIFNETGREDIKECNYLKEKIEYKQGRVALINPPFQKGLKFVYKALEESDYCVAILSQNSFLNIDYDKYFIDEIQLWRNYQFEKCKVSICLIAIRKKREGDSYDR